MVAWFAGSLYLAGCLVGYVDSSSIDDPSKTLYLNGTQVLRVTCVGEKGLDLNLTWN